MCGGGIRGSQNLQTITAMDSVLQRRSGSFQPCRDEPSPIPHREEDSDFDIMLTSQKSREMVGRFIYSMCMDALPAHMHVCCMYARYLCRSEKGIVYAGTGVMDSYKLLSRF